MEDTELLNVGKNGKIISKLKQFFKSSIFKKAVFITVFFFICYLSTQLLNGNNVVFKKIFEFSTDWNERKELIYQTLEDIFKCPKSIGNVLVLLFMYLIVYGITNKTKLSCMIVSTLAITFGVINYIVIQVRGIAITVSDVYAIQTAMNVAKGIRPTIEGNFIIGMALYMIENILMWKFCKFDDKKETKTVKRRAVTTIIGVLCMGFLFVHEPLMKCIEIWNINEAYANSGAGLTLIRMIRDMKVKRPAGYNADEVRKLLETYEDDTVENEENLPNVLVVMNESFADLQSVFDFEIIEDNIPYFRKLSSGENVISGMTHSSKFGGGTANVEYEFLTQNTTAFLPTGAMPYQQYINKKVNESIIATMNNLNYNTYGIHSWNKNGYSRGKVYNFLQFKNVLFREDMPNLNIDNSISYYSDDESTYGYWYRIMEEKPKDENNFTFVLTMQNHLPYNKYMENNVQYIEDDNEGLNNYLQFEAESDRALERLVDFIENYDEDVIMIFFGDHQPNLELQEVYGPNGAYSDEETPFVVPFFIWANYDIDEMYDVEVSTNYLQSLLLDAANIPKNSYAKYISELREDIPVITSQYYIDRDGDLHTLDDSSSPYYDKVKEYEKVVYYQIFDNK